MNKGLYLLLAICIVSVIGGCSGDEDPVVSPEPEVYTASGNFHNFLVGDGTIDTRLSFRQGADISLANHIMPNGAAIDRSMLLADPKQNTPLSFYLSGGDGTILNSGEVFSVERDRRYIFVALGDISAASGQLAPTLLQMDALEAPPAGQVVFRITHALAGSPGPIDVYVNDQVISNLEYGAHSQPVAFDARAANQDDLIVVPAGVTPDGSNEIWNSQDASLFVADRDYEALMGHVASMGFNGNINGRAALFLHEAH
jgi:hypothetical protein